MLRRSSQADFFLPVFRFLDRDSFVNAISPKADHTKIAKAQFAILFRVADTSRRGLVSWEDFTVFNTMLKRPDADYWMAFQYFDVYVFFSFTIKIVLLKSYPNCFHLMSFQSDHSGYITFDEFKNVFSANIGVDAIPFDFDRWVLFLTFLFITLKSVHEVIGLNYTLGKRMEPMFSDVRPFFISCFDINSQCITTDNEFTQLMKGLQGERLRQAFKFLDVDQDGFIRPEEFKRIVLVSDSILRAPQCNSNHDPIRKLLVINYPMLLLNGYPHYAL